MSNAFAAVDTLPKQSKTELSPRQTRYGMVPIWPVHTNPRSFAVWKIEANKVFPFRPFIGEIGQDVNGRETYRIERMPADQILDMYTTSPYFVELTALAKLDTEDKAKAVAEVIANPTVCPKYGIEIGPQCASCWMEYLHDGVYAKIKEVFKDAPDCQRAANKSVEELKAALTKAIDEARRQVDMAIREIDDPTKGKSMFYEHDYLNIYHTHADRPKYRTSTANTDAISQLAAAMQNMAKPAEAPAVDQEVISQMIAEAVAKETAKLQAEIEAYRTPPAVENTTPVEVKKAKADK